MAYMYYFAFGGGTPDEYIMGISPGGFGTVGAILHIIVGYVVSSMTPPPPQEIQDIVADLRIPRGAGEAHDH